MIVPGIRLNNSRTREIAILLLAFLASRWIFAQLGVLFDANIFGLAQMVDPSLLKTRLLESIFYLHSQPPAFNLFVGILLKVAPYAAVYHAAFLVLGMVMTVSLFLLLRGLGVPFTTSFILTLGFAASPACVLYENWLFYNYPATVFLTVAALFLFRFARENRLLDGVLFFSTAGLLILTISFFHILWYVACTALLWITLRDRRKRIAAACALPFLLVFSWQLKNLWLFDTFSSSSWLGMNLSKITTGMLPPEERERLVREGKLSDYALIPPFSALEDYRVDPNHEKTTIPVLSAQYKKGTGYFNMNHIAYARISKTYLRDSFYVIQHDPWTFLGGVRHAAAIYFLPSSFYQRLDANRSRIGLYDFAFNFAILGRLLGKENPITLRENMKKGLPEPWTEICFFLVPGFALLLIYGMRLSARLYAQNRPASLTLWFLVGNILYVSVVGSCVEFGENNRFRFMIEPALVVLLAVFLAGFMKKGPGGSNVLESGD